MQTVNVSHASDGWFETLGMSSGEVILLVQQKFPGCVAVASPNAVCFTAKSESRQKPLLVFAVVANTAGVTLRIDVNLFSIPLQMCRTVVPCEGSMKAGFLNAVSQFRMEWERFVADARRLLGDEKRS